MFSTATIVDVANLLSNMYTNTEMRLFGIRYGLGNVVIGNSKNEKASNLATFLIRNPNQPGILSDKLVYEIVEKIINEAVSKFYFDSDNNEFSDFPDLRRLLLKDGFVIEKGKLTRTFDTVIDFDKDESLLEKLLDRYDLNVAKGHYNQAINAFNRGDWAACNGQLRSYVEELLNKLAEKITNSTPTSSHQAKIVLANSNPPLFYRELNEWLDDGQGYFETFWKRLHPHGSHPGLSDEDDSIFRLNLVLISTLEVLKRFDKNCINSRRVIV